MNRNKLENWYTSQTQSGELTYDKAQAIIIKKFDNFLQQFTKPNILKMFSKDNKFGLYIHGSVGCGKTMLINALYTEIPTKNKMRIHFHQFMQNIYQELAKLKDVISPLAIIAKELRKKYRIIFLDEMHISDIATAMILKNLFYSLISEKIHIITSSNYPPNGLYPDGLMRERFMPAITLLETQLDVIALDSPQDYRLIHTSNNNLFMINVADTQHKLNQLFNQLARNKPSIANDTIIIQNRSIPFIKKSSNIIWFDFKIICGELRSQPDYLELVQYFSWFIISNYQELSVQDNNIARRFTWLIDILYDGNKKLVLSGAVALDKIYLHGDFANEFSRTVSRLKEMQTNEYLSKIPINHLTDT